MTAQELWPLQSLACCIAISITKSRVMLHFWWLKQIASKLHVLSLDDLCSFRKFTLVFWPAVKDI